MTRSLFAAIMVLFALAGCASTRPDMAALTPTEDPGTAVAKITFPTGGEEYIGRAEFEQTRDKLLQGAPEQEVLDYITIRHLLLREARGKDLTADPAEVDQFVENIRSQTCPQLPIPEAQSETDPEALLEACAQFFGFEGAAAMRRYLQEEIIVNKLVEQEAEAGEEVHAAHILVETEEEAREVRVRVTSGGEDFGEVAREVSIEPAAQESGGDLGFFGPGQMVAPFEEAAFALEDGEISEPVQTDFGWHIIKLIERRQAEGVSAAGANAYRQGVLEQAQAEGRVEYLITPAPPPTPEPLPEMPSVEPLPEVTAEPGAEGLDETPEPDVTPADASPSEPQEETTATPES